MSDEDRSEQLFQLRIDPHSKTCRLIFINPHLTEIDGQLQPYLTLNQEELYGVGLNLIRAGGILDSPWNDLPEKEESDDHCM